MSKSNAFPTMTLGFGKQRLVLEPPVLLAPMAGVTCAPFRTLYGRHGAALATSEMVSAHTLLQRAPAALKIVDFDEEEPVRSVQLYGTKRDSLREATRMLVSEFGAEHVDLNFGCPVRKVTRKGGGAAITLKPQLLQSLVSAAIKGSEGVPVTVKLRMGLSVDLQTYMQAGKASQDAGAMGITLHARTADQLYSSPVHWDAIANLSQSLRIPVVGNGDVLEPEDAVRMMQETGAKGVMVGRGCLGRPWLLGQIADVLQGKSPRPSPCLKGVANVALEHLRLLAEWHCNEFIAAQEMRKFVHLYFCGFQTANALKEKLMSAKRIQDWESAFLQADIDWNEGFPEDALRIARLKGEGRQRVSLPDGYLASLEELVEPEEHDACEG